MFVGHAWGLKVFVIFDCCGYGNDLFSFAIFIEKGVMTTLQSSMSTTRQPAKLSG